VAEPRVVDLLPEVIRSTTSPGSPLAALAAAADDMHAPVAAVLDHLDAALDPFRASPAFVRYLAGWVDLAWTGAGDGFGETRSGAGLAVDRLRDLVAASADLAARRGTPAGLVRFLEIATGVEGFRVEPVPGEFHVRVSVPAEAAEHLDLVRHVVRTLRPAHVTSEVGLDAASTPAAPPRPHRARPTRPVPPPPPPPPP
jgi:phage tail-like protein